MFMRVRRPSGCVPNCTRTVRLVGQLEQPRPRWPLARIHADCAPWTVRRGLGIIAEVPNVTDLAAERLARRLTTLVERTTLLPPTIDALAFRVRGQPFTVYAQPYLNGRELRQACQELAAALHLGRRVAISRPKREN